MEELTELFPYLFPLFFIAVWWFALSGVARMSGWTTLAEHYRANDGFSGDKRHFQSMRMDGGSWPAPISAKIKSTPTKFAGCVTIGADMRGVSLAMLLPFRPYHPPLYIPFDDITAEPREALIFKGVSLRFSKAPGVRLDLLRSQAAWLEQKSGHRGKLRADDYALPA